MVQRTVHRLQDVMETYMEGYNMKRRNIDIKMHLYAGRKLFKPTVSTKRCCWMEKYNRYGTRATNQDIRANGSGI